MHDHMTLHANSAPYQAVAALATCLSAVGAVGVCYDKAKTNDCLGAAPSFQC